MVDARRGVGDVEALCSGCQERVHLVLVALASLSGVGGTSTVLECTSPHPVSSNLLSLTVVILYFLFLLLFSLPTTYLKFSCISCS